MAVRLSDLRARRSPFTPRKIAGTHFCYRLSGFEGHSAAGRIRLIEKSNDLIGNRTRDLPARSVVPQPTTLKLGILKNLSKFIICLSSFHSKLYSLWHSKYCKITHHPPICCSDIWLEIAREILMQHAQRKERLIVYYTSFRCINFPLFLPYTSQILHGIK
jgi:hypothetical protein